MSTPANTEAEKTKNKRSSTAVTARDDDEFILKLPKKPKTVTGANGMDYLDIETYEQPGIPKTILQLILKDKIYFQLIFKLLTQKSIIAIMVP